MEKYGKTAVFSVRLRPDWGNTTWAATAGLGSKGLKPITLICTVVASLFTNF